jgi:hypothetical protein
MPPEPIRRSLMVTLLAWGMMLMGALGLPISGITALMLIAGSYGTANAGFLDSCVMVLGPLGVLTLGFGLLRRWRWALLGTVVLLAVIGVHQGWTLVCGPSETKTYTTESGVKVTETSAGPHAFALPIMGLCAGLGVWLLSRRVRAEFQGSRPGADQRIWRVGPEGRVQMFYW